MPICTSCRYDNPEQARFCLACGTAVQSEAVDEVRKTVTVVFCDVSGSTAMGERLDPESVRRVMSRYFDRMRASIEQHGGTVEKFIGDAVMAVFGIPTLREDDALRAVRAADDMRSSMRELNEELEREFGLGLMARIGVNTGEVVAGDPSSGQAFVTGDSVNVAARFEQAASPGEILIGESTYRLVRDAVDVEPVEPLQLKGKSDRIPAYRLRSVTPGAAGIDRRLDLPMVGRDAQLGMLEQAYAASVTRSACQLVTLMGEAGVGKSRLVHEFLSQLDGEGIVVGGRCLPYGDGITYWPIVEVIRSACALGELEQRDEVLAKLASVVDDPEHGDRVVTGVAGLLGLGGSDLGPQETFWAIRRFLEQLGQGRPMVVVLDDIQWGEPTFLDLIEYLVDFSSGHPWLIVCLARTDLLEVRPTWGAGRHNATGLTLEPLTEQEGERLLHELLGSVGVEPDVAARISEASGGNPLFAQETIRMLVDDGRLVRENGHWAVVGALTETSIPPTIHALLAARLERLTHDERSVAQRASVVGKVFQWAAVAALSPEPERPAVGRSLQTLVRKELIRPDTASFAGEDAFRFSHLLIRDAAYASAPKHQRAQLHRRFASWLEARSDDGAIEYEEIRGYHLEQAYRYATELGTASELDLETARMASDLLARSGIRARSRGDDIAAVRLLDRAIELTADEGLRAERQLHLLSGLRQSGELERARATVRDIATVAKRIGDRRLRAQAEVHRLMWYEEEAEVMEASARRLISEFEESGDDAGLAKAWAAFAFARDDRGLPTDVEALERSIEHARRAGETTIAYMGIANLCSGYADGSMPVPEAIELCRRALTDADGAPFLESGILRPLGVLEAMADRFDEARTQSRRGQAILRELGQRRFVAATLHSLAEVELLAGNYAEAESELRPGLDELLAMGDTLYTGEFAVSMARAMIALRRLEEAAEMIEIARQQFEGGPPVPQARLDLIRGLFEAHRGALDGAEPLMRRGLNIADGTDLLAWRATARLDLAEVLRLGGREAEARSLLEEAAGLFEQKQHLVGIRRARELIALDG